MTMIQHGRGQTDRVRVPAEQTLAISLMFGAAGGRMLASMSETSWSDVTMSELPTGTVTLLLADVEGSTRLWETQPDQMRDAIARLDQTLSDAIATHHGVRPVEQGEGDSFVLAFARAADAVACALELQRAPLAPIKLRIGVHTGDIQLRDEGNYIGPTINRTARLRDLAHGGQTVLSGATEPLVLDQLPDGVTLIDLGSHPLRDLPRPERVVQLCHPDLHNDFPPLRTNSVAVEHLPAQLTRFIGRQAEIRSIREALAENRLVTLTGAGGAGKTRLAVQVAATLCAEATDFADGVWYVDLAPLTDPDVVAVTAARALGLPDQPGQPTTDVLLRFIRDRQMLAQDGMFVIVATIDSKTGKLKKSPDIISRGFVYLKESQDLLHEARQIVKHSIEEGAGGLQPVNFELLRGTLGDNLSKFLFQKTAKRPLVIPVLLAV